MDLQQVRHNLARYEHTLEAHVKSLARDARWMRFVGGMRVGVEILSANMFHVMAIVVLAILAANPQLRDVADAALDTEHGAAVKMWVPVFLFSVLMFVSGSVAGMTAGPIVREICAIRFLDARVALFFLCEVFPFLLLLVAPVFLYLVNPSAFTPLVRISVFAAIVVVQGLASLFIYLMNKRRVPHGIRSGFINAVLLILLVLFGMAVTDLEYTRRLGPLGMLLLSLASWAAVLNAIYVAMTKWLRVPAIFFLVLATLLLFLAQQPCATWCR